MSSFDGMCTLVTGSASGLGAAPAVALARGGADGHHNRASAREAENRAANRD
jgi:NAD(P)-dependent dehydrogenase (short-subunit alcohol dehydrogenase family)